MSNPCAYCWHRPCQCGWIQWGKYLVGAAAAVVVLFLYGESIIYMTCKMAGIK